MAKKTDLLLAASMISCCREIWVGLDFNAPVPIGSHTLELQATLPDYQIPFVPLINEGKEPFAMMVDLQKKYV